MGRLTKEPEVKVYTNDGKQTTVAKFMIAIDRTYKKDGEDNTDFISCVAFGKVGEIADKYLHKGSKILVRGSWRTGSYTKNDSRYYSNQCAVETIEFCESKKETEEKPQDGFMNVSDTDMDILPFN